MAEFITKCPHCNAELQAQDEWNGMEVECPECHKTFVIEKTTPGALQGSVSDAVVKIQNFLQQNKKSCIIAALWLLSLISAVAITAQIVQKSPAGSAPVEADKSVSGTASPSAIPPRSAANDPQKEIEIQIKKLLNDYLTAAQRKSYTLSQYFIVPSRAVRFEWIINSWNIVGPIYDKWDNDSNIIRVFIDFAMPTGGNVKKSYQILVKLHDGKWKISAIIDL